MTGGTGQRHIADAGDVKQLILAAGLPDVWWAVDIFESGGSLRIGRYWFWYRRGAPYRVTTSMDIKMKIAELPVSAGCTAEELAAAILEWLARRWSRELREVARRARTSV